MSDIIIAEPVLADADVAEDLRQPQGDACRLCGAPVEEGDRFCTTCGVDVELEAEPVEAELVRQKHFRCKNCGSEVATDPDQRSYICAFCDSTYVVEIAPEESGRQPPEFIIGFRVTPDQAHEKFQQWLNQKSWTRPSDLHTAEIAGKLQGIYMPFWSFSTLVQSGWSARIGEYWYRTESYTTIRKGKRVRKTRRVRETEWWGLSGRHHHYYSGYLISGSSGLPQGQAQRIKPFQMPALKRYQPYFLAGWLCEEYTVMRDEALERCKQEFQRREQSRVATFLPGDTHRELRINSTFSHVNSDLILLPIYLLSYRYRGKLYRFMVNGQTGKVAGDKPRSHKRTVATVAGGIIAVLLLGIIVALVASLFF